MPGERRGKRLTASGHGEWTARGQERLTASGRHYRTPGMKKPAFAGLIIC